MPNVKKSAVVVKRTENAGKFELNTYRNVQLMSETFIDVDDLRDKILEEFSTFKPMMCKFYVSWSLPKCYLYYISITQNLFIVIHGIWQKAKDVAVYVKNANDTDDDIMTQEGIGFYAGYDYDYEDNGEINPNTERILMIDFDTTDNCNINAMFCELHKTINNVLTSS